MSALKLVRSAIVLALIVVLLGGWTRLNDAGLGCPDWPGCYGTWVLPSDHVELAQGYPGVVIDLRKGWIEMIHRYAAACLGLVVLMLAVIALKNRTVTGYPSKLSLLLLGLVVLQGLFGMWTVTLKLLPVIVTLHLMGGLATLTLLVLLEQRLSHFYNPQAQPTGGHMGTRILLFCLFLQLLLGGWTSTNYAGWACSDWLLCNSDETVGYDFSTGLNPFMAIGPNYEGGLLDAPARAAIQVSHRLGALLLIVVSCWVALSLWRRRYLRFHITLFLAALGVQALLGIANIVWMLPLGLAVAHHAVAVLLLLLALNLHDRARSPVMEANHEYRVVCG
ncbi:COX15/CtaA family protein [Marinobacterium iners]|jgi:cytochrome c oxidase assembly protein subunit 15|uniref:Cytochrome c oxidase assembly protein subunit 15 n=1 Tax=Marinobacterium iners DSM 11526 TaxID=1122198 RepID=A0A1H4GXE5_9GAMM|nr:COX15/CtaA family protein [Marinobacterium iners]SEB14173.1 cytochrome c oxidase assembly protein subunit 15 [Marinobacterium iners DSM 11526]